MAAALLILTGCSGDLRSDLVALNRQQASLTAEIGQVRHELATSPGPADQAVAKWLEGKQAEIDAVSGVLDRVNTTVAQADAKATNDADFWAQICIGIAGIFGFGGILSAVWRKARPAVLAAMAVQPQPPPPAPPPAHA